MDNVKGFMDNLKGDDGTFGMDDLEKQVGDLGMDDLQTLKDMNFPVSREDAASKFQENGANDQLVERIRSTDVSQFNSFDDIKNVIADKFGR